MRSANTRILWLFLLVFLASALLTFAFVPIEGAAVLNAPPGTSGSSASAPNDAAARDHREGNPSQAPAPPEEASASNGLSTTEPNSGTGILPNEADRFSLVRTFGGLGLVISLILTGYVVIRRFGPRYLRRSSDQKSLRIVETLALGEKRSIALVQFGVQQLLIGNTASQVTLLLQLPPAPDRVLAVEPMNEAKAAPGAVAGFRRLHEVEKNAAPPRQIPPDLREKMRQLREALEQ